MKILQLIIKSCDECPYDDWDCNHPTVKFSKRSENRNIATIPDWCPLSTMLKGDSITNDTKDVKRYIEAGIPFPRGKHILENENRNT